MFIHRAFILLILLSAIAFKTIAQTPLPKSLQESPTGITHSFIAFGAETYIMGADGKVAWNYPHNTRDGFLLPNGNILMAVSRGKEYPGGAAVEITREGKIVFEYKGTQSEVNTVQLVGDGRYMLTEAGNKPRILEVDRQGRILLEVPMQAQTKDHHLQSRMTRKLANGNDLVPQLLDKMVREYAPDGKIVWEVATPAEPKDSWPFTAVRLENGNTVITSYAQTVAGEIKLLEVTPEKKVVWSYRDDKTHGIHEFQIIDTNGKPLEGRPMK